MTNKAQMPKSKYQTKARCQSKSEYIPNVEVQMTGGCRCEPPTVLSLRARRMPSVAISVPLTRLLRLTASASQRRWRPVIAVSQRPEHSQGEAWQCPWPKPKCQNLDDSGNLEFCGHPFSFDQERTEARGNKVGRGQTSPLH